MFEIKHELFLSIYLRRLKEKNQSQKQVATKLKISRAIVWKINNKKPISMKTFLKLAEWLDINPEDYIQKKEVSANWKEQKTI